MPPGSAGALLIVIGKEVLQPDVDYTVRDKVLTFTNATTADGWFKYQGVEVANDDDKNKGLEAKLASDVGAGNVGTLSGNTVQEELNINLLNDREQWRRSLAEAGLTLVDGSFEEGATANSKTDAVWHIAGGQCYTWGGAFPKVVPVGSTTATTGGVGPGGGGVGQRGSAWVTLRSG